MMKKLILSALAAGALAAGGAASAQDLRSMFPGVFGEPSTPAVVAGTYPYGTVYVDRYGRQVYVDQYGRHVIQSSGAINGGVGYDAWGRPIYNNPYGGTYYDRDGDGVADARDRWPTDRRYW